MKPSLVVAKDKKMANIYEKNGKLYINYRLNGKRVRKSTGLDDTLQNRKLLKKEIIPKLAMKIKLGDFVEKKTEKFSYYFSSFLVEHEADKGYRTRIYVYNIVNKHFSDYDVSSITRKQVKDYLFSINGKADTKKEYLKCIRGVLAIALDDEAVDKNVANDIKFKREPKEQPSPFSKEEVELLLSNSDGMLRNFLGISLYTGMRSGEVIGLMHSDILDDRITVKRSISRGRISTPKTLGSIRDIPMFEEVKEFIVDQTKRSESLYLFDYNKIFIKDVDYFRARWKKLISLCEIPYRKIYNTRHTFITAMLNSEKFKVMEIAAIVGHTSPQMILKNYAGFIKGEHLKIDTNLSLFGHRMDTMLKMENVEDGYKAL